MLPTVLLSIALKWSIQSWIVPASNNYHSNFGRIMLEVGMVLGDNGRTSCQQHNYSPGVQCLVRFELSH
eukprot:scaffold3664_cov69-Cyclotella_meneghiniana.AAC.3